MTYERHEGSMAKEFGTGDGKHSSQIGGRGHHSGCAVAAANGNVLFSKATKASLHFALLLSIPPVVSVQ